MTDSVETTEILLADDAEFPVEFQGYWIDDGSEFYVGGDKPYFVEINGRSVVYCDEVIYFQQLIAHQYNDNTIAAMEIRPSDPDDYDWGERNLQFFMLESEGGVLHVANSNGDTTLTRRKG